MYYFIEYSSVLFLASFYLLFLSKYRVKMENHFIPCSQYVTLTLKKLCLFSVLISYLTKNSLIKKRKRKKRIILSMNL